MSAVDINHNEHPLVRYYPGYLYVQTVRAAGRGLPGVWQYSSGFAG